MTVIETYPEGIYRKTKDGEIILGKSFNIFIKNGDYHLTELKVFQDGKIDCWGGLIDFEEFKNKVATGWVNTQVPAGSRVYVFPICDFIASEIDRTQIKEEEFIKEVQDALNEMNGRPTTREICFEAFQEYQKFPIAENKIKLKNAYENVPEHNRRYVLGDMNVKDYPIQEIIYNEYKSKW